MARVFARFLHVTSDLHPHSSVSKSFNRHTYFGSRKKFPHNFPTHPSIARHKMVRFPGKGDVYPDEENDYYTKMALRHAGYSEEAIEEIMRIPHGIYQTTLLKECDDKTECVPIAARVPLDEKQQEEIDHLTKRAVEHARRNG